MIDATQLEAAAQEQGSTVADVAYEMTATLPPWWLSRLAYKLQRWHEVSQAVGVEVTVCMRPLFTVQFNEACAAHVRKHFGM